MLLEHAVVHDLKKEVGQQPTLTLRESLLEHGENLDRLFQELIGVYSKKATKGLGRFDSDIENYRFSGHLNEFCENMNEDSFLSLTRRYMSILQSRIASENLATGGYVIFLSYKNSNNSYLFITMLRQTSGSSITEDLDIGESIHLELDRLHIGCQIDISSWIEGVDGQYITFIKGRKTQTTPQYFLRAIGCEEYSDSSHQTNELIRAIKDFATVENFNQEQRQELQQKVYDFCANRESILLDALSNLISEEEPSKFLEFINQGGYRIGNGFEPHKKNLKILKEVCASGEGIQLKFPRNMLGTRIFHDEQRNVINIINPPESIVNKLREES